jgi:hypothetical protein
MEGAKQASLEHQAKDRGGVCPADHPDDVAGLSSPRSVFDRASFIPDFAFGAVS